MFNPIEMLQAQGGAGMQAMAQQFGLTPDQAGRAMEALMPALTLGLQRGAGLDPGGVARMFGMPEVARAAAPHGLDTLGQMFGSAQLMQAVLQQASATSGVGAQVLRQMLPMMAGAVVASIVHVMLNQPQPEPARAPAAPPPVPFPMGPVWAEMVRAFLPAEPRAVPAAPAKPASGKPPSVKPLSAKPSAEPSAASPERVPDAAGSDMIEQMFRTGAEVQGQNIRAMQELFEAFWPAQKDEVPTTDAAPPEPDRGAPRARRGRQTPGDAQ